jgi:hypothetical protein
MSNTGTSDGAYQRQPAPGQPIDPRNPPIAHQDPAHADDLDKASGNQADPASKNAIGCDYVDVVRLAGGQPRFLLQPHLPGGAVAMPAFTLETEGARALAQHLKHLLTEGGGS